MDVLVNRLVTRVGLGVIRTAVALILLGSGLRITAVTVVSTNYHGWSNALVMDNEGAEVVIVPSIGRVMQFRFKGESDGPFWENRALDGKIPDAKSSEWGNFGGDKTWPAPQGDWPKVAKRGWPPPPAFDSMAVEATVDGAEVVLTTAVDPNYGMRAVRRIKLASRKPEMTITTVYEKVSGDPSNVSVWIITQLKDPERVFMPVKKGATGVEVYNKQSDVLPANLKHEGNLLSMTRDEKTSTKIGNDAGKLFWMDRRWMMLIESSRVKGKKYPDNDSSAEVYTNGGPLDYVELELLGPLQELKAGQKMERRSVYKLKKRGKGSPEEIAKQLLKP